MSVTTDASRRAVLLTKTDPLDARDGGTLRVSAVVGALRDDGWTVDVVPAKDAAGRRRNDLPRLSDLRGVHAAAAVSAEGARIGSASVARWIDPRVAAALAALRSARPYDLAVVEFSQLLVYRPLLQGLPVMLDMHNREGELLRHYAESARSAPRRALARWEAARLDRLEGARSLAGIRAVTTVSEQDRASVERLGVDGLDVATAPNGVADSAFTTPKARAVPGAVIFVAHLGWRPNVDAVRWLVDRVWPLVRARRPEARLVLVGRSPASEVRALHGLYRIEVRADVPSTAPHLAEATVAVAPLQAAGGTRLKILEALASGTPVVATPLGAMGLERLAGPGMDVEADPRRFAEQVLARLDRPGDADAIRALAEPYRWSRVLTPLVRLAESAARKGVRA